MVVFKKNMALNYGYLKKYNSYFRNESHLIFNVPTPVAKVIIRDQDERQLFFFFEKLVSVG